MKISKLFLVGFIAVILGACSTHKPVEDIREDFGQVFSFYYQQPDPQHLKKAMSALEEPGVFAPQVAAPLTGFLSALASQRPQDWQVIKNMSFKKNKELNSIWSSVDKYKQLLEEMLSKENVVVVTPEDLDFLWGAFATTGDSRFAQIVARSAEIPLGGPLVKAAAEWSLSSQREQHPLLDKALQAGIQTDKEAILVFNIYK